MIGYQALHATAKFLHHDKVLLRSNYWFIFLGCTPVHLMLFFCILNWCHSSRILSFLFTAAVQGRRRSARLHRNSNLLSTNQTRANSACAEDNPSNLPIITNPFQMKNETPHSPASPAAFLPPSQGNFNLEGSFKTSNTTNNTVPHVSDHYNTHHSIDSKFSLETAQITGIDSLTLRHSNIFYTNIRPNNSPGTTDVIFNIKTETTKSHTACGIASIDTSKCS